MECLVKVVTNHLHLYRCLSPEGYTRCVEACDAKGVEPSLRHLKEVALEVSHIRLTLSLWE